MRPKRLISLLVAVCMMITMLPLSAVTAFAEDTSTGGTASDDTDTYKYEYTVNNGNATITKFLGPVGSANLDFYDIKIPSELGGHPVTGLGEYSFAANPYDGHQGNPLCSKIRSVTIPQSVTSIGDRAFDGCSALTTLSLGEKIKTIGNYAFLDCTSLTDVTIPQSVTSIGYSAFEGCTDLNPLTINGPTLIGSRAFAGCTSLTSLTLCADIQTIGNFAFDNNTSLETVTLPENLTSIGEYAFANCTNLKSITIPKNVKTIKSNTFKDCSILEYIILPAGLTSFGDNLEGCPDKCVIYSNKDKDAVHGQFGDTLAGHKLLGLCHVTFDANGGTLNNSAEVPVYETEKIIGTKANKLKATDLYAINHPTRTGYNFTGWYTTADGKPEDGKFDVDNTAITKDITLYARWEFDPKALDCHPLTVTGGTVTVKYDGSDVTSKLNSRTDATTGKKTYSVPDGAEVTVTLDKTLIPEGMVFDIWSTGKFSLPLGQDYKAESITFTMNTMSSDADIAAQYRDATIEDDGPNVLGTAAIIGTAAVGGAVLGYQAYSLGTEFAGKLMALPYFPSNRSALAMMLWEDAGKSMPESELLYPDVGQEERDMDLQHAARWAMENELIPDLNDEGTAPEEMKFFPANPVSKLDVLNAWQKAQELKNN